SPEGPARALGTHAQGAFPPGQPAWRPAGTAAGSAAGPPSGPRRVTAPRAPRRRADRVALSQRAGPAGSPTRVAPLPRTTAAPTPGSRSRRPAARGAEPAAGDPARSERRGTVVLVSG